MWELLRYCNTLAALTLIILFVKDVENFHQNVSKNTILWREKERKKAKECFQIFRNIHFFKMKISNLINYSNDMRSSIASFKPSSEKKKKKPKKTTTCFATWFPNVGSCDHHSLVYHLVENLLCPYGKGSFGPFHRA
jgi:hypothetical protein